MSRDFWKESSHSKNLAAAGYQIFLFELSNPHILETEAFAKNINLSVMATTLLLIFLFIAQATSGVLSATFTFKNNCPYPIWPATLANPGTGISQLQTTGFRLNSQESRPVDAIPKWSGRFWARTRCSEAGTTCETADCGSGQVECNGLSGSTPSTLVELTLDGDNGQDTYDVSLIDGFNLPVSVAPQGGQGCRSIGCPADVNGMCPQDFSVKSGADTIACKSACGAFNDDAHCCRGPFEKTCPPTEYSMMFKKICPDAYSYAKDDPSSTFSCGTGVSYLITFCP